MDDAMELGDSLEHSDDITQPKAHFWTEVTVKTEKRETKFVISDPIPKTAENIILMKTLASNLRNAQQAYNYRNMPKREAYESHEVDGQLKGKFTPLETDMTLQIVATLNRESFAAINNMDIREIAMETRLDIPSCQIR